MTTTLTPRPTDPSSGAYGPTIRSGRMFGGIVLAAFVLYGVGSAYADQPYGIALVLINSVAVAFAGWIGFRLSQRHAA